MMYTGTITENYNAIPDGYTMYGGTAYTETTITAFVLAPLAWWQANYPSTDISAVWHGVILFTQPADIPGNLFGRLVRFGSKELKNAPYEVGNLSYRVMYAGERDNGSKVYAISQLWDLSRFQHPSFRKTVKHWIGSQFATSPWDATAYPLQEVATAFTNLTAVQGTAYPSVSIGVFGNPLTWDTAYTDSIALCEAFVSAHAELSPPT